VNFWRFKAGQTAAPFALLFKQHRDNKCLCRLCTALDLLRHPKAITTSWIGTLFFKNSFVLKQVLRVLNISPHQACGARAFEYGFLASQQALRIDVGASALGAELGLFFGLIATRLSTAA
jgi:Flp pilus assembly pilin Flp